MQLNRPIPQPRADAQPTFKVEVAAKLLPKLGADHELEVYLITFQKIAKLNNWPKEYWPAIHLADQGEIWQGGADLLCARPASN